MLVYLLYGLFFVSCLVVIVAVLLQPGKADAGALFTSNISSTAFGPRGTQSVLSKVTIGAATVFMVSALLLAMPAVSGDVSVLNRTTGTTETTAPPANNDANNAVSAPTDANSNAALAPTNSNTTNANTATNQ